MTVFVQMPIVVTLLQAVRFGRNDRLSALLCQGLQQLIGVVALVRQQGLCVEAHQQGFGLGNISDFTAGEHIAQRIPQGIDRRMNLGAQPAAQPPERWVLRFFWAPAACWCALTTVLSIIKASRSRSVPNWASTRRHTPVLHQRLKRVYMVCQLPNSAGKSRHSEPVRAIHSTASTKRRLSVAVTPLSLTLPGSITSIFDHWLSLSSFLIITLQVGCPSPSLPVDC